MIAPCGMNCALCIAHQREKNQCPGCLGSDKQKPRHCVICRIKNCAELESANRNFCYECSKFPCSRLKQLDKRYRSKYGMSMIENLQLLSEAGSENFIAAENLKWQCKQCSSILCVHHNHCLICGEINGYFPV